MSTSASSSQTHLQPADRAITPAEKLAVRPATTRKTRYTLKPSARASALSPLATPSSSQPPQESTPQLPASARRTPPPPLDAHALSARGGGGSSNSNSGDVYTTPSSKTLESHVAPQRSHPHLLTQPTKPHRGVAMAVLNRLLKSQPPETPSSTEKDAKDKDRDMLSVPFSATAGAALSDRGTSEQARTDNPNKQTQWEDEANVRDGADATDNSAYESVDGDALPWWKRILIDVHYRRRLMQLSTEAYRRELKLLHDTPEAISSSAGMEKKKVWRERRWWTDDLADETSPLHFKQDEEEEKAKPATDTLLQHSAAAKKLTTTSTTTAAAAASASPPIKDEIDETIVMSQHVVLKIPPPNTISSTFAQHHPHAVIHASALETIRGVALGVMPPVQHAREQAAQEAAIDAHLQRQRRLSRETALPVKRRVARDILAGREEVPMQTAITDAVLEATPTTTSGTSARSVALTHVARLTQQVTKGRPSGQRLSREGEEAESTSSNTDDAEARSDLHHHHHQQQPYGDPHALPLHATEDTRPGTPPRLRRRLPPGNHALLEAQHAVNIAAINIRSSALATAPVMPLKGVSSRALLWGAEDTSASRPRSSSSSSNSGGGGANKQTSKHKGAAAAAGQETTRAAMYAEQQRQRCEEAALACTDGTENLYGLQYIWRLPLPPSGFIRVAPDPRYAMWPDEAPHGETGSNLHAFGDQGGGYRAGATQVAAATSITTTSGAAGLVSSHHRQREMRRLARRVNQRTRKLHWLHEIGRRRVCYNDLALLSDSEASSMASSMVFAVADPAAGEVTTARAVAPHGLRNSSRRSSSSGFVVADWDPQSPARFSLNVVRQLERQRRRAAGNAATSAAAAERRRRAASARAAAAAAARRDAAQPLYDGALNINIYAEVLDRKKLRDERGKSKSCVHGPDWAASMSGAVDAWKSVAQVSGGGGGGAPFSPTAAAAAAGSDAWPTNRVFLGCYRQSRLLVHYKVYCRALHEEARVRCGPPLTHVTRTNDNVQNSTRDRLRASDSPPYQFDRATSALLRHVPRIPFPVLRVQTRSPTLRQPLARQTPVLSSIGESRCWVGLFPSAKVDLTSNTHQAWRALRESALVQQALRDIFEDLPHDKEGLVDKRTFVLFVLQLLELFFPTHLSPTLHLAIAEEEWVYRGTTEHVGPRTFHEKFFGFPFIFLRNIAAVTEEELVEFWSILRVCLRAQQQKQKQDLQEQKDGVKDSPSPDDFLAALHLLVPLTSFDPVQLRGLVTDPPPAFNPLVYDRFCLLTAAYRSDPVVHQAPRAQQYAVAHTRVEYQLRQLEAQRRESDARKAANGPLLTSAALTASLTASAAGSAGQSGTLVKPEPKQHEHKPQPAAATARSNVMLSLTDLLSTSAGTTSRIGVENAVQQEREEHQRHVAALEKRALLEQSAYYQKRQQHLHERAAAALSGIECTSSSWELHRADVYEPPSKSRGDKTAMAALPAPSSGHAVAYADFRAGASYPAALADGREEEEEEEMEDVEDALLEYLDGVPPDVFNGRVSLRERYLLHAGYQHRRQEHKLPWLQHRANTATSAAATAVSSNSATPSEAASRTQTIRATDLDREAKTRRFLSVMKGEGNTVQERQHVVAAEYARLLGSTGTGAAKASTTQTNSGDVDSKEETSNRINRGEAAVAALNAEATAAQTAMTASYAAGMYPLRPVPRTVSSIITPSDPRARAHILEQEEYELSDGSGRETGEGEERSRTARKPRRTPSRIRTRAAAAASAGANGGSSLHGPRSPHARPRFLKGMALAALAENSNTIINNNSSSVNGARAMTTPTPPLTVFTPATAGTNANAQPQQQLLKQRVASRVNLKRTASKLSSRGKKSFHLSAVSASSKVAPTASGTGTGKPSPPHAASTSPTPALSRPSSFVASGPRAVPTTSTTAPTQPLTTVSARVGGLQHPARHDGDGGPRLARPIATVAFLDAASESNTVHQCETTANHHHHHPHVNDNNSSGYNYSMATGEEDGNSTVAASVLLESSRSFFNSFGERHLSNASSVGSVRSVLMEAGGRGDNDGSAGQQPQQVSQQSAHAPPRAVTARTSSVLPDTHYAGRLRAQQRRQQQYKLHYNTGGKPSSIVKR